MNVAIDPTRLSAEKFAIGQPVSRKEDPVLLRGEGRYTDDLNLPGELYAVVVRSRVAHGILRGVDFAEAAGMPGVHAVYTAKDLIAAGIKHMQSNVSGANHDGRPVPKPAQMALATDKVRYVGDPVAVVIADTIQQAKDAAEAVVLDIEPLPAVTEAREAAAPGAPQLYEDAPGNLILDWRFGDHARVDEAIRGAAHVTKLAIRNSRVVVCALEPRSAIADYQDGHYVMRMGCQGVFGMRNAIRNVLGVPQEQVRVLTGNVGGSFGMKASCYPEYVGILHAAKQLGRPVKWTDERSESFLSDSHGRDHDHTLELALDRDGHFLAIRVTGFANVGANLSNSTTLPPTMNIIKNMVGVYRTPLISAKVQCVFTNTTPVGAYRGAGRPEGNYYMERLVDTAAREIGIDRVELRRRNHITPDMIPYKAPSTMEYDSGDFPTILDRALAGAEWDAFAERRAESRRRGKMRGRGIGHYLEVTAPQGNEMGGIRFEADGTVTIVTGTLDYGQGHATPFAQVLADQLGIPFEKIRLVQGDSDQLIAGGGTGGSRSIMQSGNAIVEASQIVIENGRKVAAHVLEAGVSDIEFSHGRFSIVGTDRGIDIMELASKVQGDLDLPDEVPETLDASIVFPGVPSAFPNGCHVCEVEIDPETGHIAVVKYSMVNDFGVLVNPLMVEGQAHGGIVQGIGQALTEACIYDEDGQFVTGSFMDYALPRADHAPAFAFQNHPVPARTNKLGVKGCGEAGCAGSLPSVMNAVVDALSEVGITHIDMPATPAKVWRAIQDATRKAA
ncbi:MAG TPA: xanthine dehydrogenase family protein molybdopterin-binding subunit [Acetobacteraceae bacterium]|jgi:carbon-monoxide dehydrogenase large subunit|nr:xanthine dehydrogenase family protein molybdopterin-binding subunit [Acetobacteraceae bacterium]